ncbi:hypothetical protein OCK02_16070 [Rhizobium sp. TRM96647]|uniref:hypothetical protein n=1 Tax=unclassified Rhizobium TaxID=2613769 RepID=UPI0021E823B1|nr:MULTISPECIES: hypothetical protein [unclassified Rhizobium]MCV3737726.1 hypothetical protein [Rhizobium sp. TRM96647]MCV3759544.1 hypothetical protein [Rhizobium sp. TRM96650]
MRAIIGGYGRMPANRRDMQAAHIIHAYIALHKTDLSDYIAIIGSGMIRNREIRAQTSSADRLLKKWKRPTT